MNSSDARILRLIVISQHDKELFEEEVNSIFEVLDYNNISRIKFITRGKLHIAYITYFGRERL